MITKQVAIAELEGAALDWAVAEAIGAYRGLHCFASNDTDGQEAWIFPDKVPCVATTGDFSPSTHWSQCGPLIDFHSPLFNICKGQIRAEVQGGVGMGPTYKIAACRAIVAAHNPDGFVEVPDEVAQLQNYNTTPGR